MEVISINIKNPKAKKLITDLVDLDLIEINTKFSEKKTPLRTLLDKIRANSDEDISLEQITSEVEAVRKEKY